MDDAALAVCQDEIHLADTPQKLTSCKPLLLFEDELVVFIYIYKYIYMIRHLFKKIPSNN